jgi:hypothetical protein
LQNDLISQKNEELGFVSNTVEAELKTNSSALQQSCSIALSLKNIVAAVQKVAREYDWTKEILVFDVAEERVSALLLNSLRSWSSLRRNQSFSSVGESDSNGKMQFALSNSASEVVILFIRF